MLLPPHVLIFLPRGSDLTWVENEGHYWERSWTRLCPAKGWLLCSLAEAETARVDLKTRPFPPGPGCSTGPGGKTDADTFFTLSVLLYLDWSVGNLGSYHL